MPRILHIFSLTDRGAELAKRLQMMFPDALHSHAPAAFSSSVRDAFSAGQSCIFICATGIVIRTLAPVLQDKYRDPPVLVLDEYGEYVIPLLSGHEGGAGELAWQIAKVLDARCVVTSSTDYSRPVYTLGMGCDRGCPIDVLQSLLEQHESALPEKGQIKALASIDLKADETGLLALAKQWGLPFEVFSAAKLRQVEDRLSVKSEVVFREVGVYGVAEAAALLAASAITGQPAELVLLKQKNPRSTLAVARSYMPRS